MAHNTAIVVPARLDSRRLAHKVLAPIGGRPLLLHTLEMARRAEIGPVYVATGDPIVAETAINGGFCVLPTPRELPSGTHRVAYAARALSPEIDVVVNVQADEPMLCVETLGRVAHCARDWDLATAVCRLTAEEWRQHSVVKALVDQNGEARWFTRARVPARLQAQDEAGVQAFLDATTSIRRHLGIYGLRRERLADWANQTPTLLAETAGLEQLTALEAGWRVGTVEAPRPLGPAVDTPEDLAQLRLLFEAL